MLRPALVLLIVSASFGCTTGAATRRGSRYSSDPDGPPANAYVGTWLDASRSTALDTVLLVLRPAGSGRIVHAGAGPHPRVLRDWHGSWFVTTPVRDTTGSTTPNSQLCLDHVRRRSWRIPCAIITPADSSNGHVLFTLRALAPDTAVHWFVRVAP